MSEQYDLFVSADGAIEFVHDDELVGFEEEGDACTMRASHVEPAHAMCPHCDQMVGHAQDCDYERFKKLERGWLADMRPVGGPVLGANGSAPDMNHSLTHQPPRWPLVPFKTRAEALAAERAWLATEMEQRQVSDNHESRRQR